MFTHKTDKKKDEPITPIQQSTPVFSTSSRTRRSSREPSNTCSSSSSLYETTYDNFNTQSDFCPGENLSSAVINDDSSSDEDSNTDTDLDLDFANTRLSNRKSQEFFKHDWNDLAGNQSSPTFNKQKHNDDYFSPKEHTPIFKRLISKNSLKPQLKSFKRITAELQHESVPLENEVNHEKLILLNLQDEEHFLNKSRFNKNEKTILQNNHSYKKFDIIKKANESWNMKKYGSLRTNSDGNGWQNGIPNTSDSSKDEQIEKSRVSKKRSFDNDSVSKSKRRAVSTSPISSNFLKRGNMKLISNASEDLEHMSLG